MRLSGSAPRPRRHFHQPPGRENARGFKEYATVKGTFAQDTGRAVLMVGAGLPADCWLPYSVIDPSSRLKLPGMVRGQDVELRVELRWAMDNKVI